MKITKATSFDLNHIRVTLEDGYHYDYEFTNSTKAQAFTDLVYIAIKGDVDCPAVGEYLADLMVYARRA